MPTDNEFGRLLTIGLKSIDARENRSLGILRFEIADELNVSEAAVQKWQQGQIPKDPGCVEYLARESVQRGQCDYQWLRSFLKRGLHPDPDRILFKLFPDGEVTKVQLRHNLSRPQYTKFIGRKESLESVKNYLSNRYRQGVVCISGQGGVGKTSLAYEIANFYVKNYTTLPRDDRFDAIVFVSAKRIALLPRGMKEKIPSFTDLDGVFREIANVLGDINVFKDASIEEKLMLASKMLRDQRTLLILDNLEDVDDDQLLTFLRDLPIPSKVLVTTRHRIDIAVPVHLSSLSTEEARELVLTEAEDNELALTDDEVEKIVRATGRMPLAIVRTLGRLRWRDSKVDAELAELRNPSNDYYSFVYSNSLALIRGRVAHKLFLGLSLFPIGATRDAIGFIAGINDDVHYRDQQLEELEVLSLVDKYQDRFILNDLTMYHASTEMEANKEFKATAFNNWINWYREHFLSGPSYDYQLQKTEIPNIIALMAVLLDQQNMPELIHFFRQNHDVLNVFGYWDDRLTFVNKIIDWAVDNQHWETVIEFFPINITSLHTWKRIIDSSKKWLQNGRIWGDQIQEKTYSDVLKAHVKYGELRLIRVRLLHDPALENSPERKSLAELAMSYGENIHLVYRQNNLPIFMMSALFETGSILCDEEKYEEASAYYANALTLLDDLSEDVIDKERWQAVITFGQSLLAARKGNYEEACNMIKSCLANLVLMEDTAAAHIALAYYETKLGHYKSAEAHREKSQEIKARYNLQSPICLEDKWWLEGNL